MIQAIGYAALLLLMIAFIELAIGRQKYFLRMNIFSTILFVVYAILQRDWIFAVGQLFIVVMLMITYLRK